MAPIQHPFNAIGTCSFADYDSLSSAYTFVADIVPLFSSSYQRHLRRGRNRQLTSSSIPKTHCTFGTHFHVWTSIFVCARSLLLCNPLTQSQHIKNVFSIAAVETSSRDKYLINFFFYTTGRNIEAFKGLVTVVLIDSRVEISPMHFRQFLSAEYSFHTLLVLKGRHLLKIEKNRFFLFSICLL